MFTNQIINYERQKKAKMGDEVTISGDSRTYIKYSKIHNGHSLQAPRIVPCSANTFKNISCLCNLSFFVRLAIIKDNNLDKNKSQL